MFAELVTTARYTKAVFKPDHTSGVAIALLIRPVGSAPNWNRVIRGLSRIIDDSRYSKPEAGSCAECCWRQMTALVKLCLAEALAMPELAVKLVLKDRAGVTRTLDSSAKIREAEMLAYVRSATQVHQAEVGNTGAGFRAAVG